MFKKFLKWAGIVIGSLLVLVLLFYSFVYFKTQSRANTIYQVKLQQLALPTDSASLALGKHLFGVRGCKDCHSGGGVAFFDESNPIATLYSANLTAGKGGIQYKDEDWLRALRHGIGKDGKPLWFMPVQHTTAALSNKDLGALIAYIKQLPAVDNVHPQKAFKPLGRLLTFFGKFPMFPAEVINHNAAYVEDVKPEVSVAYGKYLAIGCEGCHGPTYKGGPGHSPGEPYIPDISSSGAIKKWSSEQFIAVLHTGKTPEGKLLSDYMPWRTVGVAHSEDELKAIYLYLQQSK